MNGTVNANGDSPTHIYGVSGGPQTALLQPGQNTVITSPADVTVDPGGSAAIVTSDGSTVGVGPNVAATLIQTGSEPSLNAWDFFVKDVASGWTVRFSDLSLPLTLESTVSAPNATDGLTLMAPDNSTQVMSVPPEQFVTLNATWSDPGLGDNTMQISQIVATIQGEGAPQFTWIQGSGWSQTR